MIAYDQTTNHPVQNELPIHFCLIYATQFLQESVSNAELSRKLDLILGKVSGLEERVGKLESDNAKVKGGKAGCSVCRGSKISNQCLIIPKDEKEKESFEEIKNQIYAQESKILDLGKKTNWGKVEKTHPRASSQITGQPTPS